MADEGWTRVISSRRRRVATRATRIQDPDPEDVLLNFNCNEGDYAAFIDDLRRQLADHEDSALVHDRPLLAKQRCPARPARWMRITLVGDKNEKTVLAVRDDNVYLIGFMNQNEHWFEFGFSGEFEHNKQSARLIPGSTFLECDVNYGSLLDGGAKRLVQDKVKLGREFAREAVRWLWAYRHVNQQIDVDTKRALARLIVMICESARMIPHYNTVKDGWDHGTVITKRQVRQILNWGNMSRFLIGWTRNHEDGLQLKDINIWVKDDAAAVVHLVLNSQEPVAAADPGQEQQQQPLSPPPPPPSAGLNQLKQPPPSAGHGQPKQQPPPAGPGGCQQQHPPPPAGHGRPLVEVFSVRANFPVVGTIAVFDGKRGQIIWYENNRGQGDAPIGNDNSHKRVSTDLVLNGPYRAISADGGSFAIKVDPSGSDESGDIDGATLWECNVDKADADVVVESSITTDDGEIVLTYAVLSNAMEATVQVNLVHSGDTADTTTHIYGKISAHIPRFDVADSVLVFNRGAEEKVELVPSTAGLIVPLARSVVVVPIGSPLEIKIRLHATSIHEGITVAIEDINDDQEWSFDEHTEELGIDEHTEELGIDEHTEELGIDGHTGGTDSVHVGVTGDYTEGMTSDEWCSDGSTAVNLESNGEHERTKHSLIHVKISNLAGHVRSFVC